MLFFELIKTIFVVNSELNTMATGTKGNLSRINEDYADDVKYSLNDLLYLQARTELITKYYNFLRAVYRKRESNDSMVSIYKKNEVNWHLGKAIVDLGFVDEVGEWVKETPNKAMAIELLLFQKSKKRN